MLGNLGFDLRLAWRGLRAAKALTGAAVLTLAVGIAATTSMFALVYGVLLRPLPVADQDRLIVSWKELRESGFAHYPFGGTELEAVKDATQLLEAVAGVTANGAGRQVIAEDATATYVNVALVTGAFFDVLGTNPVAGRSLRPTDDVEGAETVAVISEGLWRRRYGSSRTTVGRRVTLGEQRFTIVGVMPSDLDYPRGVELWRTTRSVATSGPFGDAARQEVDLIARMKPGVRIGQAAAELEALTRQLEPHAPRKVPRGLVPIARPLTDVAVGEARTPLLALFAAVALVLLIATANVANLLLMRAESRRVELAVREALGARRGRILRHLFAESLILAAGGAAVGLALAWWGLGAMLPFMPDGIPRVESVRIDGAIVIFTAAVACLTTLLSGLAPALSSSRVDLVSRLRSGGPGITGRSTRNARRALVVAQVTLAVVVVIASGLLTRTLRNLQSVNLGLTKGLVFVDLALPGAKYADRERHAQFLEDLISRFETTPQIAAATPVNLPPFTGDAGWDVPRFTAEGQHRDRAAANPALNLESVHPNYFETFEVPIVRGRSFTRADRAGSIDVAIVSEDVAARTWPGQDPIGKRLKLGGADSTDRWRTVVGVAGVTRYRELTQQRPTLYLPATQFLMTAHMLVLRTPSSVDLVASLAGEHVKAIDPLAQVTRVASFEELLAGPLARPRFNAFLSSVFGAVALLLAAIGLYGVLAAHVRLRDREIGIRIALGASINRVRQLVLGEAMRLAGLGAALGLAVGAITTPVLRGMLFGIDPVDHTTSVVAALMVVLVSAVASYLPVRRATRLDPASILRGE